MVPNININIIIGPMPLWLVSSLTHWKVVSAASKK